MKNAIRLSWLTVALLAAVPLVAAEPAPAVKPLGGFGLLPDDFLHIPGPNPVLVRGPDGAWDDGVIEAADALEDNGRYYFYYHGTGRHTSYRLGVAVADAPFGPFAKHGDRPILDVGPAGAWDDRSVACGMVLKEGHELYRMWYSGTGTGQKSPHWSIGLATAPHPLGPWKKYDGNPVLRDFGYVGGVVKVAGQYRLYTAYPIGSTGPDYAPIALATADAPQGPWTRWPANPVLSAGSPQAWDDGGFSEAEVFAAAGAFHLFYGGAKIHPERIRTRESIGYAFSNDGFSFRKHPLNPVAPREAHPNAAAFAEVHAIHHPPAIFLYHTLRYIEPRTAEDRKRFPLVEDLGIEALVTARPFRLVMPACQSPRLGPLAACDPLDCRAIATRGVQRIWLTIKASYPIQATAGLRVVVEGSLDGLHWDPQPLQIVEAKPAASTSPPIAIKSDSRWGFLRFRPENHDAVHAATDVLLSVALEG